MASLTVNYSWTKPVVGGDNDAWGGMWNANLDGIDSTIKVVSGVADGANTAATTAAATAGTALTNANNAQTAANGKLALAGGTITGNLVVNGTAQVGGSNVATLATALAGDVTGTIGANHVAKIAGLALPATPGSGAGQALTYNGTTTLEWRTPSGVGGPTNLNSGASPPASPTAGTPWWDTKSAQLYVYHVDANGGHWVIAVNAGEAVYVGPGGGGGGAGPAGTVVMGGDVQGDSDNVVVTGIDGLAISGYPNIGQTLVVTAPGNILTWQTLSGSGPGGDYLPLAGGTLTGALTGTAATFSSLTNNAPYQWQAGLTITSTAFAGNDGSEIIDFTRPGVQDIRLRARPTTTTFEIQGGSSFTPLQSWNWTNQSTTIAGLLTVNSGIAGFLIKTTDEPTALALSQLPGNQNNIYWW